MHLFPHDKISPQAALRTPHPAAHDGIADVVANSQGALRQIDAHILALEEELEILRAFRSIASFADRGARNQDSNDNKRSASCLTLPGEARNFVAEEPHDGLSLF
jgi:hypothetical protein